MNPLDIEHMLFIRHGESQHHVLGLSGGWTDTPLTEKGRSQVSATAEHLKSMELGAPVLYCSDLQRAMESAAILGRSLGCEPIPLKELREFNNGDAVGLSVEEARSIQNPEPDGRNLDWRPYRNGETWREMAMRVSTAFSVMEVTQGQTLFVVGHGNSGQALVSEWLGLGLDVPIAFHFDAASVTELRVNRAGEREIASLNVTYHLT